MVAVNWSAVFSFPVIQRLLYDFVEGQVSHFFTAGSICVTDQAVFHQVALSIITGDFWRRAPSSSSPTRAQTTAFLNERFSLVLRVYLLSSLASPPSYPPSFLRFHRQLASSYSFSQEVSCGILYSFILLYSINRSDLYCIGY